MTPKYVGHDQNSQMEIAAFWSWFTHRSGELAKVSSDKDPVLHDLLRELQRIHAKLFFELCSNSDPRELILTVEGRRDLFPLVDAIIADAPHVEGWVFVSLKPAMGFDFQTKYEGVSFDPASMWFVPLESRSSSSSLGLRVGIPGLNSVDQRNAKNAILVMLDTALGERSAAADIQHVEVTELPPEPESHGYIRLKDLPDYIQWLKRRLGRRQ